MLHLKRRAVFTLIPLASALFACSEPNGGQPPGGSGAGTTGNMAGKAGAVAGGSTAGGSAGAAPTNGGGGSAGATSSLGGTAGTPSNLGGSGTAGSGTAGSGTAGSGTAGSGTAGSGTAGTGTAGTGTAGTGTAGTAGAAPGTGGAAGAGGMAAFGGKNGVPAGGSSNVSDPEPPGEIIGFGRRTTGGLGGREVVVTTAEELIAAAASVEPLIITVKGAINHAVSGGDDNARIWVTSNKTIQGADPNASVDANFNIREATNVIFRNITLTNVEGKGTGDAVEFTENSNNIWVNHVTFGQCKDGALDFKRGCDDITVSWCKFEYASATHRHNYANLIGHVDTWTDDRGKLKVTMHHNWYSTNVIERMPRVRYGQVHVFNNYYSSERTNYVIGVGVEAQILLEASYFENQGAETWFNWFEPNKCTSPCGPGKIRWTDDNVFLNTTVSTWAPNSEVFVPPYEYRHVLQTAAEAKASVMARAGILR